MDNTEVMLQFLKQNGQAWCDDCLSEKTGITPRQQINQLGSKLSKNGMIFRNRSRCAGCSKIKIINSLNINPSDTSQIVLDKIILKPKLSKDETIHPWYWEGNIQSELASFLIKEDCKLISIANTTSHESGKDIIAKMPDGKELWISVKGWPEKSSNTQARHWFSQGLFDIILYREESKDIELALAFPEGFQTYHNLARRIKWFKELAKFKIYWISENGSIQIE